MDVEGGKLICVEAVDGKDSRRARGHVSKVLPEVESEERRRIELQCPLVGLAINIPEAKRHLAGFLSPQI